MVNIFNDYTTYLTKKGDIGSKHDVLYWINLNVEIPYDKMIQFKKYLINNGKIFKNNNNNNNDYAHSIILNFPLELKKTMNESVSTMCISKSEKYVDIFNKLIDINEKNEDIISSEKNEYKNFCVTELNRIKNNTHTTSCMETFYTTQKRIFYFVYKLNDDNNKIIIGLIQKNYQIITQEEVDELRKLSTTFIKVVDEKQAISHVKTPIEKEIEKSIETLTTQEKKDENPIDKQNGIDELTDPVSLELFENPVIASDGHTYSKSVLDNIVYNSEKPLSPLTREELQYMETPSTGIINYGIPNIKINQMLNKFKENKNNRLLTKIKLKKDESVNLYGGCDKILYKYIKYKYKYILLKNKIPV
jgi:hypothetical protein